jgi:putative peptidoglycan lipid II flippase
VVALVNFVLLLFFMRRKLGRIEGRHLFGTFLKICSASFVMAVIAWLVNWQVGVQLPVKGTLLRLVQVPSAIAAGVLSFYFLCRAFGIKEIGEAVNALAGKVTGRLQRVLSKTKAG